MAIRRGPHRKAAAAVEAANEVAFRDGDRPRPRLKQRARQEDEKLLENEHATDEKAVDKQIEWEFGGPFGTTAIMAFFPLLMYYMWICQCEFKGALFKPEDFSAEAFLRFAAQFIAYIQKVRLSQLLQHSAEIEYKLKIDVFAAYVII